MRRLTAIGLALMLVAFSAGSALATHSWANYHWQRSANPVHLDLGTNLSSAYTGNLSTARTDWAKSDVLDLGIVTGAGNKNCGPVSGRIEVCNDRYGYRNGGWLGVATIWASGDHITQATVKLNDTFLLGGGTYDSNAWRQMVTCQEVGHTFGLDHQDENFYNANLGTCMDYTTDPSTNQHPDKHDYDELDIIYSHLDGGSGGGGGGGGGSCPSKNPHCSPAAPGRALSFSQASRAHGSLYVDHFANGVTRITHVFWVPLS
jgi:hypothetical protein